MYRLKLIFAAALMLLLSTSGACAYDIQTPVTVSVGEISEHINVDQQTYTAGAPGISGLDDLSQFLIQQADSEKPDERLTLNTQKSVVLSRDGNYTHAVVHLINDADEPVKRLLMIEGLFFIAWAYKTQTGDLVSHQDAPNQIRMGRDFFDFRPVIPLHFEPGEQIRLHIGFYSAQLTKSNSTLWHPDAFRVSQIGDALIDGAAYGMIIALAVYNLFLFAAVRYLPYLFFAGFSLASGSLLYLTVGTQQMFPLLGSGPTTLPMANMSAALIGFFAICFTISLLNIHRSHRYLFYAWCLLLLSHLIIICVSVYSLMAVPNSLTTGSLGATVAVINTMIAIALSIYTLIFYWKRLTLARWWFIGINLHLWALYALSFLTFSDIETGIPGKYIAQATTIFDLLLLSYVISVSLRLEQSAHSRSQKESLEHLRLAHDMQKAKANFVSTVGHDLRGQVQAIRHYLEPLRTSSADPKVVNNIERNTDKIAELTDAMVQLANIEHHADNPRLQIVSLREMAEEINYEFSPIAIRNGVSLNTHQVEGEVFSDRVCLSQVFRNLVDNALKYTDRGEVTLSTTAYQEHIAFRVEDTGVGIPADSLTYIFDEFYRVESASHKAEGVGLGLSIVSRLTRLLGIEVEVSSKLGEGTSFVLNIPKTGEALTPKSEDNNPSYMNGRGLVVDVDDSDPQLQQMRDWGYVLHHCNQSELNENLLEQFGFVIVSPLVQESHQKMLMSQPFLCFVKVDSSKQNSISKPFIALHQGLSPMQLRSTLRRRVQTKDTMAMIDEHTTD